MTGISAKPLVHLRVPDADSDGTAPGKGRRREGRGDTFCPMSDGWLPCVKGQAVFVKYTGYDT